MLLQSRHPGWPWTCSCDKEQRTTRRWFTIAAIANHDITKTRSADTNRSSAKGCRCQRRHRPHHRRCPWIGGCRNSDTNIRVPSFDLSPINKTDDEKRSAMGPFPSTTASRWERVMMGCRHQHNDDDDATRSITITIHLPCTRGGYSTSVMDVQTNNCIDNNNDVDVDDRMHNNFGILLSGHVDNARIQSWACLVASKLCSFRPITSTWYG